MDIQEIQKNFSTYVNKLAKAFAKALTEENKKRFQELVAQIGESADDTESYFVDMYQDLEHALSLVLEMAQEPLQEFGIEIGHTRTISSPLLNRVCEILDEEQDDE